MEALRILIVDDTSVHRILLRKLIETHPSMQVVAEADSVDAALEVIDREPLDVIFLDVQMPGKDGFALLRGLVNPPRVVFVSAWPGFAIEAFSVDAVDYLLKPVQGPRFDATVARLERLFRDEQLAPVPYEAADRICLRTTESTIIVPVQKIVALEASGDFTQVHIADQPSILACRRVGDFDESLPSPPFARLDRSMVVNLDRVARIEWLSRDLMEVQMRGLLSPLQLGRTAGQRLRSLAQAGAPES